MLAASSIFVLQIHSCFKPSCFFFVSLSHISMIIFKWYFGQQWKFYVGTFILVLLWWQRYVIGFNHGLPCYVKNMARGTLVDKNRGRRPRFLSWLRPEGHVFNIVWQAMIKTYYSMFPLWLNRFFSTKMQKIVELECYGQLQTWLLGKTGCCYGWVA